MKRITKSALGLALVILATSCAKQPDASFTTDKTEYVAGETIKLKNTSIDGVTYKWTMPDGQTFSDANVDYITNVNQDDATFTFRLIAFSKKDKKSDEAIETVKIKAAKGNAVLWQKIGTGYGITVVQINGVSSNITQEYASTPECGAAGCAVFNDLKVGSYNLTASDGTYSWSGTIKIEKDKCTTLELQ